MPAAAVESSAPNPPADELADGLARLGVAACDDQIKTLLAWLDLLDRWNRAFNLTAIPPARRIAELALMSAAAVPYLRPGRVLDAGSGAGVPGVALAVLAPDNDYTLLDANGKKARFLRQCRFELGLENVRVEHARVETLECPPFDTVVARAFASLDTLMDATRRLMRPGARWLAFKGGGGGETQHPPPDKAKWRIHRLQIPGVDRPASLVAVQAGE